MFVFISASLSLSRDKNHTNYVVCNDDDDSKLPSYYSCRYYLEREREREREGEREGCLAFLCSTVSSCSMCTVTEGNLDPIVVIDHCMGNAKNKNDCV